MRTVKKKKAFGDLPLAVVIAQLKNEIIEEARSIATGRNYTLYPMIEKTKELIELETQFAKDNGHGADQVPLEGPEPEARAVPLKELDESGPIKATDF